MAFYPKAGDKSYPLTPRSLHNLLLFYSSYVSIVYAFMVRNNQRCFQIIKKNNYRNKLKEGMAFSFIGSLRIFVEIDASKINLKISGNKKPSNSKF